MTIRKWTQRRSWRGSIASLLLTAALVSFGAVAPTGAAAGAGVTPAAGTPAGGLQTTLQFDLPPSLSSSCHVFVLPWDPFNSAAAASCKPHLAGVSELYYRIYKSVAGMNGAYATLVANNHVKRNSGCSNAWELGECGYRHKGWPDGRYLRIMSGKVPIVEVTYPSSPILLTMYGRAGGEAALERSFASAAAAPDDYKPIAPKPSPSSQLLGLVPAALRPSCKAASKPAYAGASASVSCPLDRTAVHSLYYDLFPSVAAMNKQYASFVTSVAHTTMGSNCSNTWALGECDYKTGGVEAGRDLRLVYKNVDWLIWTSTKERVIVEAEAPGTDGPALEAYWATGAANPG